MSRYSKKLPNGRTIAWGYDEPLSEYFLQEFKSASELTDPDEDETVFSISSFNTLKPRKEAPLQMHYSNGEILRLMRQYGELIPDTHKISLAMDLPF